QLQESCKRGHDTCEVGEACDINCRSRAKEGTTRAKLGKHATSIAGVVQKRARHVRSWGSMRHQLQESCKRGHDTCEVGEACDINCRSRAKEGTTRARLGNHATSIAGVVQKRARHGRGWGIMRH